MTISAQLGMRGSTSWDDVSGLRPQNYRERLLYEYPNGDFPITSIIATQGSKELTDDYTFHWYEEELPTFSGAITAGAIYVDSGLGTAYVYATHAATSGAAGGTVYAKVAEAVADEFIAGYKVVLADLSYQTELVRGIVTGVHKNGASSYIAIKLRQADPGDATYSLATVDWIAATAPNQPELASMPNVVSYDPTHYSSYTGIYEVSVGASRTAMKTRLRTGNGYEKMKRQARERFGVFMEKDILYSYPYDGVGDNGERQHEPMGIFYYLSTYSSDNVIDFSTCTTVNGVNFSGKTWKEAGTDFLLTCQELFGRYGDMEKMAVCGSGATNALGKLAASESMFTITPGEQVGWGIKVNSFDGGSQSWKLKVSPLMSQTSLDRNTILLFEPANIVTRFVDDMTFCTDPTVMKGGPYKVDGRKESYLGEIGWEFHFPKRWAVLRNIGVDNIN